MPCYNTFSIIHVEYFCLASNCSLCLSSGCYNTSSLNSSCDRVKTLCKLSMFTLAVFWQFFFLPCVFFFRDRSFQMPKSKTGTRKTSPNTQESFTFVSGGLESGLMLLWMTDCPRQTTSWFSPIHRKEMSSGVLYWRKHMQSMSITISLSLVYSTSHAYAYLAVIGQYNIMRHFSVLLFLTFLSGFFLSSVDRFHYCNKVVWGWF